MKKQNNSDEIKHVKSIVQTLQQGGATYQTCVQLAFNQFNSYFFDRIKNLIHSFPQDAQIEDPVTGVKTNFWSGVKRFPQAAVYNVDDPLQTGTLAHLLSPLHSFPNFFL